MEKYKNGKNTEKNVKTQSKNEKNFFYFFQIRCSHNNEEYGFITAAAGRIENAKPAS